MSTLTTPLAPLGTMIHDPAEYRELLTHAIALEVDPQAGDADFYSSLRAFTFDDISILRVSSVAQDVRRTRAGIRNGPADVFKVLIERDGHAGVAQFDDDGLLPAGSLVVYDTALPYRVVQFETFVADAIFVPRARLPLCPDVLRAVQSAPLSLSSGPGAILDSYLKSLWTQLPQCSEEAGARCLSVLVELLTAALGDIAAESLSGGALRSAAISWIGRHLDDADLDPAAVARATGLSVRYLHRLFADSGVTVSAYIRSERLRHIRHDLGDRRLRNRTIAAIGARWGISDPAHLSRLFKAHYGHSPRDVRQALAERADAGSAADSR
ncbi:helix-turn-helix domain-containing protein [Nocardia sp. NPDC050799]|uniref:helix-turn-helix domain-containing protein n=1 Tax=Nocardia sp. NPDC050799 TaxID=3154842 RepID=UPI0033FA8ABB